MNPEQSFVAWNAFVTRGAWFWEDAADTKNPSAASNATPVASQKLFCNPLRPAIEASFARRTGVTDICAARSLVAAEVDLFPRSGFNIFPDLLVTSLVALLQR